MKDWESVSARLQKYERSMMVSAEALPEVGPLARKQLDHELSDYNIDKVFFIEPEYNPSTNSYTYRAVGFEIIYDLKEAE
jgi:hypothetical protein